MIERTMEDEYRITDLETGDSIPLCVDELPDIIRTLGFIGRKTEDIDAW